MATKSVCASVTGAPPPLARLFLDTIEFIGCMDVVPGDHVLVWEVVGAPGQSYTVSITSPDDAKWSGTFTIPQDHDEGRFKFAVKA